jgi:ornithine cyclodeaminase
VVLVLSADDVRQLLTPDLAIASQRVALGAAVTGRGRLRAVARATDPRTDALAYLVAGQIAAETGLAAKVVLQLPANARRGLPTLSGVVVLFDPDTGVPLACLNGAAVTALRTSAGLAVAADALAAPTARTLGVLGSGVQSAATVRMVATVRDLDRVRIWGRTPSRAAATAAALEQELRIPVRAVDGPREAVTGSDIVATCTLSRGPVVRGGWLAPGQTVLTMGSYEPDRCEVDDEVSARAQTFVDELPKAVTQCGPVAAALAAGIVREGDLVELGSVLCGDHPGRGDNTEIVAFHSLGIGYQDAAAGWAVYRRAVETGRGTAVPL